VEKGVAGAGAGVREWAMNLCRRLRLFEFKITDDVGKTLSSG
jgi:hypothetical protein